MEVTKGDTRSIDYSSNSVLLEKASSSCEGSVYSSTC